MMKQIWMTLAVSGCISYAALSEAKDGGAPVSPKVPAEIPQSAQVETPEVTDHSEWSNHLQMTTVTQAHGSFNSPYSGVLSLKSRFEVPTSFTTTLFVGRKLWKDAYVFVNPEESAGAGLSGTHGIAAFPNGEIYRVDDPSPKINLSRLFFQQDFGLGGGKEKMDEEFNQFASEKDVKRLTVVAGKFSLNDYLDDNTYSHDPRTQFLNWALMDYGSWDYAADTRGYSWGVHTHLHLADWSFKVAVVQVPASANGLDLDGNIAHAHGDNVEIEHRYKLGEHPGKFRVLGYMNHSRMGNYRQAINQAAALKVTPDITTTRSYSTKYGAGLNIEQELTADAGVFARIGFNDGATETWAFTEIDRSYCLGASLKGSAWHRPNDNIGLALMLNGLSGDHQAYLAAGGNGFIVGDGPVAGSTLTYKPLNYSMEQALEVYYLYKISKSVGVTPDFQFVRNPGYNSDRGSVTIYGLRLHLEI